MPVFARFFIEKEPLLFLANQKIFALVPSATRNPQYPRAVSRIRKEFLSKNSVLVTHFEKPRLAGNWPENDPKKSQFVQLACSSTPFALGALFR